jgi:hypothetical protein
MLEADWANAKSNRRQGKVEIMVPVPGLSEVSAIDRPRADHAFSEGVPRSMRLQTLWERIRLNFDHGLVHILLPLPQDPEHVERVKGAVADGLERAAQAIAKDEASRDAQVAQVQAQATQLDEQADAALDLFRTTD